MRDIITTIHTYTYSLWKQRNEILHHDTVKTKRQNKRQILQDRIENLNKRDRANLTSNKQSYFKRPVAIR